MRKILLSLLLLAPITIFAQDVNFTQLSSTERGEIKTYTSKKGYVYKVGDKITLGQPKSPSMFTYVQKIEIGWSISQAGPMSAGAELTIKKLNVLGQRSSGYFVSITTEGANGLVGYIIRIENALEAGELKGNGLTSDEALTLLKKEKDKLDLGLITQAEFDAKKAELAPLIK